jgi:hypothetical protein
MGFGRPSRTPRRVRHFWTSRRAALRPGNQPPGLKLLRRRRWELLHFAEHLVGEPVGGGVVPAEPQ